MAVKWWFSCYYSKKYIIDLQKAWANVALVKSTHLDSYEFFYIIQRQAVVVIQFCPDNCAKVLTIWQNFLPFYIFTTFMAGREIMLIKKLRIFSCLISGNVLDFYLEIMVFCWQKMRHGKGRKLFSLCSARKEMGLVDGTIIFWLAPFIWSRCAWNESKKWTKFSSCFALRAIF